MNIQGTDIKNYNNYYYKLTNIRYLIKICKYIYSKYIIERYVDSIYA